MACPAEYLNEYPTWFLLEKDKNADIIEATTRSKINRQRFNVGEKFFKPRAQSTDAPGKISVDSDAAATFVEITENLEFDIELCSNRPKYPETVDKHVYPAEKASDPEERNIIEQKKYRLTAVNPPPNIDFEIMDHGAMEDERKEWEASLEETKPVYEDLDSEIKLPAGGEFGGQMLLASLDLRLRPVEQTVEVSKVYLGSDDRHSLAQTLGFRDGDVIKGFKDLPRRRKATGGEVAGGKVEVGSDLLLAERVMRTRLVNLPNVTIVVRRLKAESLHKQSQKTKWKQHVVLKEVQVKGLRKKLASKTREEDPGKATLFPSSSSFERSASMVGGLGKKLKRPPSALVFKQSPSHGFYFVQQAVKPPSDTVASVVDPDELTQGDIVLAINGSRVGRVAGGKSITPRSILASIPRTEHDETELFTIQILRWDIASVNAYLDGDGLRKAIDLRVLMARPTDAAITNEKQALDAMARANASLAAVSKANTTCDLAIASETQAIASEVSAGAHLDFKITKGALTDVAAEKNHSANEVAKAFHATVEEMKKAAVAAAKPNLGLVLGDPLDPDFKAMYATEVLDFEKGTIAANQPPYEGRPGMMSGIVKEDIIIAVNGHPVFSPEEVEKAILKAPPVFEIRLLRPTPMSSDASEAAQGTVALAAGATELISSRVLVETLAPPTDAASAAPPGIPMPAVPQLRPSTPPVELASVEALQAELAELRAR